MLDVMLVDSLHIYPVKAARGIALTESECLRQGLRNDRRFMVIDAAGKFITQRSHASMALVEVTIDGDRLHLHAAGARVDVPLDPCSPTAKRRPLRVWDAETEGIDVPGEGSRFFSDFLGEPCTLVYMPIDAHRDVEEPYSQRGDRVGFADAYPLLIASLASLADLNEKLAAVGSDPVGIERFRANIVVEGGAPFAEDEALTAHVGDLVMRTPKRCARCVVVTIDQTTAIGSKEPLRTLARYRTVDKKVLFGVNAIPDLLDHESLSIHVGDEITYRR